MISILNIKKIKYKLFSTQDTGWDRRLKFGIIRNVQSLERARTIICTNAKLLVCKEQDAPQLIIKLVESVLIAGVMYQYQNQTWHTMHTRAIIWATILIKVTMKHKIVKSNNIVKSL